MNETLEALLALGAIVGSGTLAIGTAVGLIYLKNGFLDEQRRLDYHGYGRRDAEIKEGNFGYPIK